MPTNVGFPEANLAARAIRWVPAGLSAPRAADDLALYITQDALRQIMRHLGEDPERELMGFLVGAIDLRPDLGAQRVTISAAVRARQESGGVGPAQIPPDEWERIQGEVRARGAMLVGWYHSAPFVGPTPVRLDISAHRARFHERWQCGLVVSTVGAPAGGFFRPLGNEGDVGTFLPFHEVLDHDALLAGGPKRTLIDWGNYITDDRVVHDDRERWPRVPPLGAAVAEQLDGSLPGFAMLLPQPEESERTSSTGRLIGILVALGVVALALILGVITSKRQTTPQSSVAAAPAKGAAGPSAAPATTPPAGPLAIPSANTPRPAPSDTASAAAPARTPTTASPAATAATETGTERTPTADPAVQRFDSLADSLARTIVNYRDRRADFSMKRLTCRGLAVGYESADDALIALSAVYHAVNASLDSARRARYTALSAKMDSVNQNFDESRCPRP
jgi:proteasome lid subunit RPN8/RPN11